MSAEGHQRNGAKRTLSSVCDQHDQRRNFGGEPPEFFAVSPSYRRMYVMLDEDPPERIDTLMIESVRVKEAALR